MATILHLKTDGPKRIVQLPRKPRVFTEQEEIIEFIRTELLCNKDGYRKVALDCNLSSSTIQRLASGQTRWPKPSTLFPLMERLGLKLTVQYR